MNNGNIKHILVALDAGNANHATLQAAASLAKQFQAELQALFVEDINLIRLAELPFAREILIGSHAGRRITSDNIQRQMQQQAARLRGVVDSIAQQGRIKVEFNILRGHITHELCQAAQHMDLLILDKNTQSQQGLKLGKVAQDVLSMVSCNVMLLQQGATIVRPVAVMFDGSEASQRALQLAIQLAQSDHDQLKVIYPASDAGQQLQLQQQVNKISGSRHINPGHIQLTRNTTDTLLQAIQQANTRVLILEASSEIFNAENIRNLIQHSHIPVIVTR